MAYNLNSQVFGEGDYEGMPDVFITEVGTTKSTKTNSQGKFTFPATSASSMIRFQMLGYKEKVVKASDVSTFVNLESESLDLDEITVNGTRKTNTLLYVLLACGTILLTASIVAKNKNKPQKVQLK